MSTPRSRRSAARAEALTGARFVVRGLRRGKRWRDTLQLGRGEGHPLEPSRGPLLLVYWLSVLHKLNYDFIDPDTSCASYMYRRVTEALPLLPRAAWAEHVAIWGTLAAETALPLLLLGRRSWPLGLVAALSFHLVLGFDPTPGIYSFTSLLFALFVLVLPDVFVAATLGRLDALVARAGHLRLLAARVAGVLLLAGLLAVGATRGGRWAFQPTFIFFVAWAALVIAGYGVALLSLPEGAAGPSAPPRARPPALVGWALPGIVLLNGLNPYLGLRTQLSFSMFSNLRTEGGLSNHLFMPRVLSLGGYQEDLVEIVASDDPDLAEYPAKQLLLPYFEFRRLVSDLEDVRVTYRRSGAERTFLCQEGRCNDAELAEPHSRLLGRLLSFRPVDKGPQTFCRH